MIAERKRKAVEALASSAPVWSVAHRVGREPYGSPPLTPPYVPFGIRRFTKNTRAAGAQ